MQKQTINRILKHIFFLSGALITANGVLLACIAAINVGVFLTFALGVSLLLCGILGNTIAKKVPKLIQYTLLAGLLAIMAVVSLFYLYGSEDNTDYTEDVLIVLGAGIRGEDVPKDLAGRLDAAIRYHKENPNAIIVVSGGQGTDEDITEALAMQRYLTDKGVPEGKILREECSTSTKENFLYSKKLLDDHFDNAYRVAFVTSDFHIFRAEALAAKAGFANATHLHSSTPWYSLISNGLRECLGILKLWIIDT